MRISASRCGLPGLRKSVLGAGLVFTAMAAGLLPSGSRSTFLSPAAQAQNNFGQRVVSGTVMTADSQPVAGATVFLQNQKTKTIRSFTSVANGHFSFAQVDKAQDFNLWAEKDGKKSSVKTISSWDTRNAYFTDLTLK